MVCSIPVSYTHLDVYKRQDTYIGAFKASKKEDKPDDDPEDTE